MQKFRNNETNVLLATNINTRGINLRNSVLIINVGVPKRSEKDGSIDVDTYIRRASLLGRHSDKGIALTITEPHNRIPLIESLRKVHNL